MPTRCEHVKRTWHNNRTGAITFSRYMPTAGKDTHSMTSQSSTSFGVRRVTPWDSEVTSPYVSESLAAYPDLLNRFIVAKISKAVYTVRQEGSLQWRAPLKGLLEPTDKDKPDDTSIGGLRNTSDALSKLSFTAPYGLKLGECLRKTLDEHPEWTDQTFSAIGPNDDESTAAGLKPRRLPAVAIA